MFPRLVPVLLAALAFAGAAGAAPPPAPLLVFAAASLKGPLDAVAADWRAAGGTPVRIAYAGTPALARQLQDGAPADLFVSADVAWMDWAQARGLVDAGSRRDLLGNRLVLVALAAAATPAPDLSRAGSLGAALGDGRLALAETGSVPAGRYAKQALEHLGQWPAVAGRLAETDDVRTALAFVARGEAPLGIVYATDAAAEPSVRVLAVFPADSHAAITYPAALLARPRPHPDAAAFLAFLSGPRAAALFRAAGFEVR